MMIKSIFALSVLAAVTFCGQPMAAEFAVGPRGFGVSIVGEIKKGDFERFKSFTLGDINQKNNRVSFDFVFLDSPGGSVEEALQFADLLTQNFSMTVVPRGKRCFSACTIIWAGGVDRFLERDATLGFHRLSFNTKEVDVKKSKAKTDPANKIVAAFFRDVGLPALLIDKMNETSPSDRYVVNYRWLIEHELDRTITYQPTNLS